MSAKGCASIFFPRICFEQPARSHSRRNERKTATGHGTAYAGQGNHYGQVRTTGHMKIKPEPPPTSPLEEASGGNYSLRSLLFDQELFIDKPGSGFKSYYINS